MLPALGSLFVIAIKDSAIASVIAVPELLRQTQIVAGKTYPALRALHRRDDRLFPPLLSGGARRRPHLPPRRASRARHDLRLERRLVEPAAPPRRRVDDDLAHLSSPWRSPFRAGCSSRCMRLSPLRLVSRRGDRLRRVLPRHAADPADLLGLLRAAGLFRHAAFADRHGDRRPRLQHLRLQLRDLPLRHRVDPPGPVECRPGARHDAERRLRCASCCRRR